MQNVGLTSKLSLLLGFLISVPAAFITLNLSFDPSRSEDFQQLLDLLCSFSAGAQEIRACLESKSFSEYQGCSVHKCM